MTRVVRLAAILTLGVLTGCGGDDGGSADSGPPAVDQCTNATDIAIITALAAMTDGGIPDGGVPDGGPYPDTLLGAMGAAFDVCTTDMNECLPNILAESMIEECLASCLATNMSPAADISAGCTACNVEVVYCASTMCIAECLGSDRSMCEACAAENCVPRYSTCSGLPAPAMP